MNIVKVILEDGTELTKENTTDFQDEILQNLDDSDIKHYSTWNLDLIEKDEANEYCDCDEDEDENCSIVESDLTERVRIIIEKVPAHILSEYLSNLENEYNIV